MRQRIVIRLGGAQTDTPAEVRETEETGVRGPRIRCPLCDWTPHPEDLWACACGHHWHTFDTGGVCPSCLQQWLSTQCHVCHGWSAHSDWYQYA